MDDEGPTTSNLLKWRGVFVGSARPGGYVAPRHRGGERLEAENLSLGASWGGASALDLPAGPKKSGNPGP